jgi:hypothetical protein
MQEARGGGPGDRLADARRSRVGRPAAAVTGLWIGFAGVSPAFGPTAVVLAFAIA